MINKPKIRFHLGKDTNSNLILKNILPLSESGVAQSCLSLCNPMACSLPGFSVHGIFQARILEWVTISFSRRSSQPRDWTRVSCIVGRRFTVWATREVRRCWILHISRNNTFHCVKSASVSHLVVSIAHQAPLSMGLSRQECWSGKPLPSPGDLPDPRSPALQADSLPSEPPRTPHF